MSKSRLLRHAVRLSAVFVSLFLLFEVGVRMFWTSLPNDLRMAIAGVRILPWSEHTLDLATFRAEDAAARTETLDVLILGDSFAFCWMDSTECWAAHLSAHGWRALSAASLGSGSNVQLETLRHLLLNLQPRLIIWQWYYNDADDNCRFEQRNAAIQALIRAMPERPPVIGSGLGQYSALARMIGNWLRWRAFMPPQPPPVVFTSDSDQSCKGNMASVLSDYATGMALAAAHNIAVVIALVPHVDEVEGAQGADSPAEEAHQMRQTLLAHCAAYGYHCFDPTEALRKAHEQGQSIYNRSDLHLTAHGNRLFAEMLIAYIERRSLLPPP